MNREIEKYKDKLCLVIGGGKSGIGVAGLLSKKLTKNIIISDVKDINSEFQTIKEEKIYDIVDKIDFAVKSPGIRNDSIVIKALKSRSIKIFSEVETGLWFSKTDNTVMITGTNGKSTTTYLTYKIFDEYLRKIGKKAIICGNIGKPVSEVVGDAQEGDWLIIEISSYQIEDSNHLNPTISAILNITPDHIEHHKTIEAYIEAKLKLIKNLKDKNVVVLNNDDKILNKINNERVKIFRFSVSSTDADAFYDGKNILTKEGDCYKPSTIPGIHNIENQMAAILISRAASIDRQTIQEVLSEFKGLEHRIEIVGEINGVRYINDSKATNVDSTLVALKAVGNKKNIYLILGGQHKGSPYLPLIPLIKKYVKKVLLIGEARNIIKKELDGVVEMIDCKTLENAIEYAYHHCISGDIVLLSPACASFDQFKNFEERGEVFKKIVNSYEKKKI